jgi:hypothetical protein
MNTRMTCDFNALRRSLAAAYNRHVDELEQPGVDDELRESCCEIGNCIAALLALESDDGIADLSDEVTLRSPFGDDDE